MARSYLAGGLVNGVGGLSKFWGYQCCDADVDIGRVKNARSSRRLSRYLIVALESTSSVVPDRGLF
jgi:hypothetical protein